MLFSLAVDVEKTFPPGAVMTAAVTGAIVFLARDSLVDDLVPLHLVVYHAVDGAPVGQSAKVAVVNEKVDLELAAEMVVVGPGLLGVVAIDGIELNAPLTTPIYRFVEQLALTDTPQDKLVMLGNEHAQRLDGEGQLLTNFRVFMSDDGSVEINCDGHILNVECRMWNEDYFLMELSSFWP